MKMQITQIQLISSLQQCLNDQIVVGVDLQLAFQRHRKWPFPLHSRQYLIVNYRKPENRTAGVKQRPKRAPATNKNKGSQANACEPFV